MNYWLLGEIDEWFLWIKVIGWWFKWFGIMDVGLEEFVAFFNNFLSQELDCKCSRNLGLICNSKKFCGLIYNFWKFEQWSLICQNYWENL